jgi:hypothetical protein
MRETPSTAIVSAVVADACVHRNMLLLLRDLWYRGGDLPRPGLGLGHRRL